MIFKQLWDVDVQSCNYFFTVAPNLVHTCLYWWRKVHLINLKEFSYFWFSKMVHVGFKQLKVSHLPGMMHSLSLLTLGEGYLFASCTWPTSPLSRAALLSLGLVHDDSGWSVVLRFTQSGFSEYLGFSVVILWCLRSGCLETDSDSFAFNLTGNALKINPHVK